MIKLFVLLVNYQNVRYRCMLENISIGVGCKEGGAAWGTVCRERCVAGVMGVPDLLLQRPKTTQIFTNILYIY